MIVQSFRNSPDCEADSLVRKDRRMDLSIVSIQNRFTSGIDKTGTLAIRTGDFRGALTVLDLVAVSNSVASPLHVAGAGARHGFAASADGTDYFIFTLFVAHMVSSSTMLKNNPVLQD